MKTILVVEDYAMSRQVLKNLFGYMGHRVLEAADGTAALALARAQKPELIISDIVMPVMDGIEFVRTLRREPGLKEVPVIFYTATYRLPEARRLASEFGMCRVIHKPADPPLILEAVNEMLGLPNSGIEGLNPSILQSPNPSVPPSLNSSIFSKLETFQNAGLQLAMLMDLNFHLVAQRDPMRLLETCCSAIRSILDCRYARLALTEENGQTRYFGEDKRDSPSEIGAEEIFQKVMTERSAFRWNPGDAGRDIKPGSQCPDASCLILPLAGQSRVYGWICVADKREGAPFSDQDEELAVALSTQTSIAYENLLIKDQLQRQAAELRTHQVELQAQNEELRAAQQELEASRVKYADLYNFAPAGHFTLDIHGLIEEVNLAGAKFLGMDKQFLLKKPFSQFISGPEDKEVFTRHRTAAFKTQNKQRCDLRLRREDGTFLYAHLESTTENHDGKAAGHIRTAALDITERKQAEEALRQSEQRFRLIAETSADIIFQLDTQGRVTYCSPAATRYGYNIENITGSEFIRFVSERDLPKAADAFQRVISGEKINLLELQLLNADGTAVFNEINMAPIVREGTVVGIQGITRDITERKQAQEELIRLNEELETRVRERTEDLAKTIAALKTEIADRKRAEKAVKAERQQFNDLLETIPAYLVLLRPDYHVAFANRFFRERFGESHGRRCFEYLFGRADPCDICETFTVLKTMMPHQWEWTGPDGRNYFIYDFPFIDTDGSTLIMEMGIDITEQKQAQEALRRSRESLKKAQTIAHIGSWHYDMKLKTVTWSDELYRIFGRDPGGNGNLEAMVSKAIHPHDRYKIRKGVRQLLLNSKADPMEYRIILPDGEVRTVWAEAEAVFGGTGKAVSLIGTIQDITERKRAEEELSRLATAVQSAADALVVTDPTTGLIQYVNPAFEKITGYSKEDVLGRDLHLLDSGRHDETFYENLRQTLHREGFWTGRLVHKRKDGTLYEEECTYSTVKNESGKIINYISIKRDVTEKVRLESIAQAMETMNNIGYIFSGISHEIGNPINAINMTLNNMKNRLDDLSKEKLIEYINNLLTHGSRVGYLLKSFKSFNMYENMNARNIELSLFLDSFLSVIEKDFEAKGITISLFADTKPVSVYADPRALQQILLNIFTNSADAMEGREDSRIVISVSNGADRLRLRIEDNGIGIEEARLKNLFKPFYTTKEKGTGLGLVIIKKMLAKMNGSVEINSRLNEGTIVEISLPSGN